MQHMLFVMSMAPPDWSKPVDYRGGFTVENYYLDDILFVNFGNTAVITQANGGDPIPTVRVRRLRFVNSSQRVFRGYLSHAGSGEQPCCCSHADCALDATSRFERERGVTTPGTNAYLVVWDLDGCFTGVPDSMVGPV